MARISCSNSKAIAKPTNTSTNIDTDCDGTINPNDNSKRQTNTEADTASPDLAKTNINAEKEVPDTKEASDTYAERDSDHSLKAKGTSM